ncbi:MAG: hypothetical protein Kow00114_23260 [Kiloniellaceae bacterium]
METEAILARLLALRALIALIGTLLLLTWLSSGAWASECLVL